MLNWEQYGSERAAMEAIGRGSPLLRAGEEMFSMLEETRSLIAILDVIIRIDRRQKRIARLMRANARSGRRIKEA